MDTIVTYRQRVGTTDYISGDRIDVDELCKRGLLNEDVVKQLRKVGELVTPTPESMAVAIARRPPGAPWPPRGWTEAELEERGFATMEPKLGPVTLKAQKVKGDHPPVAEPAPPEPPPPPAPGDAIERIELTHEKVAVGRYFLQPTRRGNLTFWTAATADGRILRTTMFRSLGAGQTFLEELLEKEARPVTPGPETSEESAHDGDVRSGSDDAEGPGSSEDR